MLKSKIKKLLNDPYKIARRDKRVSVDPKTILLDSTRFYFRSTGGTVKIGADSMIGCNFIFESEQGQITIGDRCHVGGGTQIISRTGVTIGDDVTIGWNVYLYDHDSHSLDWRERARDRALENQAHREGKYSSYNKDWSTVKTAAINVCDKAWIGFGAVILKGVTIGEGAVIAAQSVVSKDVPAWTVVAGNPAQFVKQLDKP